MATDLVRMNLMLDEPIVRALRREATARRTSMSEVARSLLARDLGVAPKDGEAIARIRALRQRIGPASDSAPIIREARDHGW